MTVNEMKPAIGQLVQVRYEEMWIDCKVVDVKTAWNKVRLQVKPVAGDGEQWVECSRVRLISQAYAIAEVK